MSFNLTLIGQTIAMVFFVWFCMKYIWPFIMGAIEARQTEIADGLAAAEKGKAALEQAEGEVQKALAEARQQAKTILDQAHARANEIVDAAKGEGEAERKRQIESALAEIEVERNRARDELRGQVAAIALAGAEQILSREISPETHRELLDGLAEKL
ncbi:MAG: F0F1 ATP synthase subunit B [Gammaproteobacteria bacterium]|nr:F0F1 ATP synthase subunit B [Gammaproteobacteria bacterium]